MILSDFPADSMILSYNGGFYKIFLSDLTLQKRSKNGNFRREKTKRQNPDDFYKNS